MPGRPLQLQPLRNLRPCEQSPRNRKQPPGPPPNPKSFPRPLQRRQARGRALHVVDEDLAGVDQQDRVGAEALAGGGEMIRILPHITPSDRTPAEFRRAEIARFVRGDFGRIRAQSFGSGIAQITPVTCLIPDSDGAFL